METVTLAVGGMNCNSCANNVTRILQGVPGVESAEVSLETSSATVRFDPAITQPDILAAAVEDGGFDASL